MGYYIKLSKFITKGQIIPYAVNLLAIVPKTACSTETRHFCTLPISFPDHHYGVIVNNECAKSNLCQLLVHILLKILAIITAPYVLSLLQCRRGNMLHTSIQFNWLDCDNENALNKLKCH